MTNYTWETVIKEAQSGNEEPFNRHVNDMYVQTHFTAIQKITNSQELTREVYTCVMTKFWERFVVKGETLPSKNINGYIYNMSRNAFLDVKRSKKRQNECELCTKTALNLVNDYTVYESKEETFGIDSFEEEQAGHDVKLKLLCESIQHLDERCRAIIRRNVYEGEMLKDLKIELGFDGTYQSIVEKKKRCIRRLSKLMFTALESIGQKTKFNV